MTAPRRTPLDVPGELRSIPIRLIAPASFHPRPADRESVQVLAEEIAAAGLLQPILVRPSPGEDGRFEVVHGERRLRAYKLLGRRTIAARVAELDDAAALLAFTVENLRTRDVPPLEEAQAYRRLRDRAGLDAAAIAERIGKSETYVLRRMKLLDLIEPARTLLRKGKLPVVHAIHLSRLQPKDQQRALGVIRGEYGGAMPLAALQRWIRREVLHDLRAAPFDPADPTLVPSLGPCLTCEKRSGNIPGVATELGGEDFCTDPAGYAAKVKAHMARVRAEAARSGRPLVELSTGYPRDTVPAGLTPGAWREAGGRPCPHTVTGLVVQGADVGAVLQVCTVQRCRIHWGAADAAARRAAERQRRAAKKARARRRKSEAVRQQLFEAVARRAPARLDGADLEAIALAFLDHLSPASRLRLARLHAWVPNRELEPAQVLARIRRRIRQMTIGERARLLRELSLIDELEVPNDQVGRAPQRLLAAAARFGIDTAAIREETLETLRSRAAGA